MAETPEALAHALVEKVIRENGDQEAWIGEGYWPGDDLRAGIAQAIRQERERAFDAGANAVDEHVEGCRFDPVLALALIEGGEKLAGVHLDAYAAARRAAIEGEEREG